MTNNNDDNDQNKGVNTIIQKRFLEERKVFLWGTIDDEIAEKVTNQFFYLESIEPGKEITLYISTPGGSITAGMAIYDTIQLIKSSVTVVVTGIAASMGSILLSSPEKGKRFMYPHARTLIHQPLIMGQIIAPAIDIAIQAEEMERHRREINDILAKASGQSIKKIQEDTDRDFYMTAKETIEYGLADKIVSTI